MQRLASSPLVREELVPRFLAGEGAADAVTIAGQLIAAGFTVTLSHLGEHGADRSGAGSRASAERVVQEHLNLLDRLSAKGLAGHAEISPRLSALGAALGWGLVADNAARLCAAAARYGSGVTLDVDVAEDTDTGLAVLAELRQRWPWVGTTLRAGLDRTLDDCRALAAAGARVRLSDGGGPAHGVAVNFVRCANVLLAGGGHPVFATHDPRLVRITVERARWHGRRPDSYEHQFRHGLCPAEQHRLASAGHQVRVHLPYGEQWYGHLLRRLAERPANTTFLLRALVSRP